jgi:FSR family fosmidomycin resistance protein-like MFS transporter
MSNDLGLTYVQVGLLLGVPGVFNTLIEPVLLLLGDTHFRKHIMVAGGMVIVISLLAIAVSHSFIVLMLGFIIAYPASGAFVSLSQATLMDQNPGREPHMMARWTLAGSLANLLGPLIIAASFAAGLGWRWVYYALAGICLLLVVITSLRHIPIAHHEHHARQGNPPLRSLLSGLWQAVRDPGLMRWMVLLQLSDLLLDVLTGYLALYFTNVMGLSVAQSGVMLSVLMGASLISNIALIPLLERIPGRSLVRLSAALTALLYPAWLLAPWLWAKILLIVLIKLVTFGWYEVLEGEAFAAVPGRSGTVMSIGSAFSLLGGAVAFLVGWVAARIGLEAAMWILLAGPVSLVVFVPRFKRGEKTDDAGQPGK